MFDSPDHAAQVMQQYFEPHHVQLVVQALVPVIELKPVPASATAAGGSRLGGLPDLPAGASWPRPPMPADAEEIAKRGNADAGAAMRTHLQARLPYAFMGQIDLAEAHGLGSVAEQLPDRGRLLFFYDLSIGPWESGERVAHVMWDETPRDSVKPLAMPADMAAADARESGEHEAILREFKRPLPKGPLATNYGAPAKPVSLLARVTPPDPQSLEFTSSTTLHTLYHEEDDDGEQQEFVEGYDAMREDIAADTTGWRSHLLLGSPSPEQDDPRYQAVVVAEFGQEFLDRETWKRERSRIETLAQSWRLLLQVDLRDWSDGALGEGTVYFLISAKDLQARRFDGVVAVYQQT